jgi:phosphorylcholine metabolism protein LicD
MHFVYVHKDDLRKWQLETLKIQQGFQSLLDRAGIDNWCGGGFLIGAAREGRFLYWDNDIDVFIKHENVKKIIHTMWQEKFLAHYEIWSQVNGYWQINAKMNTLLQSSTFDEKSLEMELEDFSRGMFKIFSKKPLEIKFYTHDFNEPDTFVQVKQFAKTNITKYRDAHKGEGIKNGQVYNVLPNLCILPMIKVTKVQYVLSSLVIMLGQAATDLTILFRNKDKISLPTPETEKGDVDESKPILSVTELDKQPKDTLVGRIRVAARITIRLFSFLFQEPSLLNKSQKYWAYKPSYFRIIVLPFKNDDVLPTQQIRIENCLINVPRNYENVLRVQFGDYSRTPAIQDRIALPFFTENDRYHQ